MVSILMPVYIKESPEHFDLAMESIYNQTFKDFEIILVIDGPLTQQLYVVVHKWKGLFGTKIKIVELEENTGLANALNTGLKQCSFDLVARMDSDDYSEPHRLEVQLQFMEKHPEVDIVGSYVSEFKEEVDEFKQRVIAVPSEHADIIKSMWFRNPMNHPSVIFRKQRVIAVGGYEAFYGDDDHLWAKMYVAGYRFHNIKQCLVKMRVGSGLYKRRGVKWLPYDLRVRRYLSKHGKMNLFQFIFVVSVLVLYRLMHSKIREILH